MPYCTDTKVIKKIPYSRETDICLWSQTALTRATNVCIHSFPVPLIAHELFCHSTQVSQHYTHTYTIPTSLKLLRHMRKYDMYSQIQMLYNSVSTYNRSYLTTDLKSDICSEQDRQCTYMYVYYYNGVRWPSYHWHHYLKGSLPPICTSMWITSNM